MKCSVIPVVVALLLSATSLVHAKTGAATAFAPPVAGIQIDGHIDDWPKSLTRYPILGNSRVYGPSDLDARNLLNGDDLSAHFMIGYDQKSGLLYLAVVVRDDEHIVGTNSYGTDAVEIYLDGPHRGGRDAIMHNYAAIQYAGIAGAGRYDSGQNPSLMGGDFNQTRSRYAYSRDDGVTIHEWAVRPFTSFPTVPTPLEPGNRVGMNIVIVDKDSTGMEPPSFVCWGPMGGGLFNDASLLGDVVLVDSPRSLQPVNVQVKRSDTNEPYKAVAVQLRDRSGMQAGIFQTDDEGRFSLTLPRGEFTLQPAPMQTIWRAAHPTTIKLDAIDVNKPVNVTTTFEPMAIPQPLVDAMEVLRKARSLKVKSTYVVTGASIQNDAPVADDAYRADMDFSYDATAGWYVQYNPKGSGGYVRITDAKIGITKVEGNSSTDQSSGPAPEKLTPVSLLWSTAVHQAYTPDIKQLVDSEMRPRGSFGTGGEPAARLIVLDPVYRLLMADDPLHDLLDCVGEVRQLPDETLDGRPMHVVELRMPPQCAVAGFGGWGSGMMDGDYMRLWIDPDTHLIRRTHYTYDEALFRFGADRSAGNAHFITIETTYTPVGDWAADGGAELSRVDRMLQKAIELKPKPLVLMKGQLTDAEEAELKERVAKLNATNAEAKRVEATNENIGEAQPADAAKARAARLAELKARATELARAMTDQALTNEAKRQSLAELQTVAEEMKALQAQAKADDEARTAAMRARMQAMQQDMQLKQLGSTAADLRRSIETLAKQDERIAKELADDSLTDAARKALEAQRAKSQESKAKLEQQLTESVRRIEAIHADRANAGPAGTDGKKDKAGVDRLKAEYAAITKRIKALRAALENDRLTEEQRAKARKDLVEAEKDRLKFEMKHAGE